MKTIKISSAWVHQLVISRVSCAMLHVGNINMLKINCESTDIIRVKRIIRESTDIIIKPINSAPRASHGAMFKFMHDIGIAINSFFVYESREFNCSHCDLMKESLLRWWLWWSHKAFHRLVIVFRVPRPIDCIINRYNFEINVKSKRMKTIWLHLRQLSDP